MKNKEGKGSAIRAHKSKAKTNNFQGKITQEWLHGGFGREPWKKWKEMEWKWLIVVGF